MNVTKPIDKLLIVDDDRASTFLIKLMLEDMQLAKRIYTAENGAAALQFLHQQCEESNAAHCPELIFLDINMPVMNGFEFLEELQKLATFRVNSTKVYMLSSSSNPKDIEKASSYSVAGYIQKPLTEEKIQALMQ